MTVRDPTAFLEGLLELEWPERRACVTPAPLDSVEAAPRDDPRSFEVLDVLVGPVQGDPAFVAFRVVVADQMRQHNWPGVAMVVLMEAHRQFSQFRRAAEARCL